MQLVKTDNYLLLVDKEAKIKELDYINPVDNSGIGKVVEFKNGHIKALNIIDNSEWGIGYYQQNDLQKIVAYYPLTKEAKELDLFLLPNPHKKENSIEKIAEEYFPFKEHDSSLYQSIRKGEIKGFIEGYKAAQSTQQLPKEFIPEYEEYFDQSAELGDDWGHKSIKKRLKIITNSEGRQELIGEYKY